jgi:hypothetical protein
MPVIPSISRPGVLVRFFRNSETYHPGVKIAINELELKSWEAFLNYLNRQPRLALASGGIKHKRFVRSIDFKIANPISLHLECLFEPVTVIFTMHSMTRLKSMEISNRQLSNDGVHLANNFF